MEQALEQNFGLKVSFRKLSWFQPGQGSFLEQLGGDKAKTWRLLCTSSCHFPGIGEEVPSRLGQCGSGQVLSGSTQYSGEHSDVNCSPLSYISVINVAVTALVNCSSSAVSSKLFLPQPMAFIFCISAPACHRAMGGQQRSKQVAYGLE